MEKLLNSLRALCLSIFTVSRWMDNPQNQRGGRRDPLCWMVPAPASPGQGTPSQHPRSFLPTESLLPHPIHRTWAAGKGKATQESDGNRRVLEARSSLPRHGEQRALGCPAPGWESVVAHGEVDIPLHLRHKTSTLRLTTFWPLFASELAPGLKKALVQDRETESAGCVIQKRLWTVGFRNKFNFGFPDLFKP